MMMGKAQFELQKHFDSYVSLLCCDINVSKLFTTGCFDVNVMNNVICFAAHSCLAYDG